MKLNDAMIQLKESGKKQFSEFCSVTRSSSSTNGFNSESYIVEYGPFHDKFVFNEEEFKEWYYIHVKSEGNTHKMS
jgi:hypothetical protein